VSTHTSINPRKKVTGKKKKKKAVVDMASSALNQAKTII
jgi:hypothetical protein